MQFILNATVILSDSIIHKIFNVLELRENLLNKHIELGDKQSIKLLWNEFSSENINLLFDLTQLSEFIYLRFSDEFIKDRSKNDNNIEDELITRMRETIITHLDIVLLIKLYTLMSLDETIFDIYKTSEKLAGINSNNIDRLIKLSDNVTKLLLMTFDEKNPKQVLEPINSILAGLLRQRENQIKYELLNTPEKDFSIGLGQIYYDQINFYMEKVLNRIDKITNDWLWYDPNLIIYTNEMILYNVKQVKKYWNDKIDDKDILSKLDKIKLLSEPQSQALIIWNQMMYYYTVGINLANNGLHNQAIKFFERIVNERDNFNSVLKYPTTAYTKSLKSEFDFFVKKVKLVLQIAQMTSVFNKVYRRLMQQKYSDLPDLLNKIKGYKQEMEPEVDIKILSAMPDLYESIVNSLKFYISSEKSSDEIISMMEYLMDNFMKRINISTNNLEHKWIVEIEDLSIERRYDKIREYIAELDLFYEIIALIPIYMYRKEEIRQQIKILQNLALSVYYDLKSFKSEDTNPVLSFIQKAVAAWHASEANQIFEQNMLINIPQERLLLHYHGSFITLRTLYIKITKYILQYLYINDVQANIQLVLQYDVSFITDKDSFIKKINANLNHPKRYYDILEQIYYLSQELIEFREKHEKIIAKIDWDEIYVKYYLSSGIKIFHDAVKHLLTAYWLNELSIREDAIIEIEQAKTFAFQASEQLSNLNKYSKSNYSTNAYSFAQLCQDIENSLRNGKSFKPPIIELLKFIKDMIFQI